MSFLVLPVPRDSITSQEVHGGSVVEARLPDFTSQDFVSDATALEIARRAGNWLWVSGGGVCILGDRYVPLVQRSLDSRTNPGKLTVASGRADNVTEILDPRLTLREAFEEIAVVDAEGLLLIPRFKEPHWIVRDFSPQSIREILDPLVQINDRLSSTCCGVREINARLDAHAHKDVLKVFRSGKLLCEFPSAVHVANDCGEVNVLFAACWDVEEEELMSLRFFDTEYEVRGGDKKFLHRAVFLYDLKCGSVHLPGSLEAAAAPPPLTPHAAYLLARLRTVG